MPDEGREATPAWPMRVRLAASSNAVWCSPCKDWIMRGAACPHYDVDTVVAEVKP